MKLKHVKTIQKARPCDKNGRFQKVTALCFSPNNMRLAVANGDRSISLYDENGEQNDRFATKPAKKVKSSHCGYYNTSQGVGGVVQNTEVLKLVKVSSGVNPDKCL